MMNLQSLSKMTEDSLAGPRQVWASPQSSGHSHKEADEIVQRELYFLLQSRSCPCLTTDSLPSIPTSLPYSTLELSAILFPRAAGLTALHVTSLYLGGVTGRLPVPWPELLFMYLLDTGSQ